MFELGTVAILDEEYYKDVGRKYPREWEMDRYSPREEIAWTFQEPRKPVSGFKALIGLGAVLGPWLILAGLVSRSKSTDGLQSLNGFRKCQVGQVMPSLSVSSSAASSALPFLISFAALEGSIAAYWVGLITVWTFMPCVAVTGLLSLLSGKSALSVKMKARLSRESDRAVGVESSKKNM